MLESYEGACEGDGFTMDILVEIISTEQDESYNIIFQIHAKEGFSLSHTTGILYGNQWKLFEGVTISEEERYTHSQELLFTPNTSPEQLPFYLVYTLYNENNEELETKLGNYLITLWEPVAFGTSKLTIEERNGMDVRFLRFLLGISPLLKIDSPFSSEADQSSQTETNEGYEVTYQIVQGSAEENALPDAPFTVLFSERLDEATVKLDVRYGGGCEMHDFYLVWNERVLESQPPKVWITLKHDNHNDSCEALERKTLYIDLSYFDTHRPLEITIHSESGFEEQYFYDPDGEYEIID